VDQLLQEIFMDKILMEDAGKLGKTQRKKIAAKKHSFRLFSSNSPEKLLIPVEVSMQVGNKKAGCHPKR
jgi:hypothetical protein